MLLSIKLHLGYLRELENSERVRAACLNYLQNRLVYFYVARPDLAAELQLLAASLGGQLEPPRLPLKYEAVNKALGREAAYRVWSSAPIVKQSLIRSWDQALHRLESWERNRPTDREETSRNSDTSLKQLSLHSLKLSSLMGAILDAAYNFWV
jgi:hypothetical protein